MTQPFLHTGLYEEIELLLREIATEVRRKGREILSDFSITPPQFDALIYLNEFGDLTIGELSAKLYLAYSTTTDLVDRLERNDLVERVRDKNDRRVVRLHMKEKGREMIGRVLVARRQYLAKVLVHVPEQELQMLAGSLKQIHDHISD